MRYLFTIFTAVLFLTSFSMAQNLVLNPGFEDGSGALPDNWDTNIQHGSADFTWVTDTVHTGLKSICITHTDSAASSFYQAVSIKEVYKYKVSGYIKTEGVEAGANWWEGGAQLRIEGDVDGAWWDNMTSRVYGDSNWTYVELDITTPLGATEIVVNCKLGEGMAIRGTVWFDEIVLEEIGPNGDFFTNGDFETGDPEDPIFPASWVLDTNTDDAGTVVLDDTEFHGGSKSCKISFPANKKGEVIIRQDAGPYPHGLVDGAVYKFSGWIKTEGVTGGRGACFITAWNNHTVGDTALHGDNNWTYIEETVVYEESDWGEWRCFMGIDSTVSAGTAWFDDVQLELISIPPGNPSELTADYDGTKITLNWDPSAPGDKTIDYYLVRKIIQNDTVGNIKPNPGFEDPNDTFDFPAHWGSWGYGTVANFTWDEDSAFAGDFCVSIDHPTGGWGMVYSHESPPEGETGGDALIRGYVKTENVSGGSGAYIGFGYSSGDVPDGLFGTNDYTVVEDYACLDGGKFICCLFGRGGEYVSGKAWFDEVTVTPFDSVAATTELTFSDTDILEDTTYYYAVRAVDVAGYYSKSVLVKLNLRVPDYVTLLTPLDSARVLEAKLTWDQLLGVDGYYVVVKKSGVSLWDADNVTDNYVTVPGYLLEDNSVYTWTVQHIIGGNYSALSEERKFIFTKWPGTFDYITDLQETYLYNGWGDAKKDSSLEGNPILIAGVEYSKGWGMHAPSEVRYALNTGDYNTFMTFIGHDDESNGGNGVIFMVVLDDDTVFTSDAKKWGDPAELIQISVAGADTLILVMDDDEDMGYDHANWADPILYEKITSIEDKNDFLPTTTELFGNYPNPFNPSTTIAYQLHKPAKVKIDVFNVIGQKVKTLVDAPQKIGSYKVNWNSINDAGSKVSSGIYFYRLKADDFTQVKKMILLR